VGLLCCTHCCNVDRGHGTCLRLLQISYLILFRSMTLCMPIEDPSTDMSAVHRLKNYDVDDISQPLGGTVDGCIVTTSAAQSEMERNMLESMAAFLMQQSFLSHLKTFSFELMAPYHQA